MGECFITNLFKSQLTAGFPPTLHTVQLHNNQNRMMNRIRFLVFPCLDYRACLKMLTGDSKPATGAGRSGQEKWIYCLPRDPPGQGLLDSYEMLVMYSRFYFYIKIDSHADLHSCEEQQSLPTSSTRPASQLAHNEWTVLRYCRKLCADSNVKC